MGLLVGVITRRGQNWLRQFAPSVEDRGVLFLERLKAQVGGTLPSRPVASAGVS
jgi:hypothetical protein